ncbi:MAG: transcription antitermination factor NusB [Eubacterium sp.]|nr:transcription antitermination factor NusB [Eubacterium sp.]
MKRTEIREAVFMLLFLSEFYDSELLPEQIDLYIGGLQDGRLEEVQPAVPREKEAAYIREKLNDILQRKPEIDRLLDETSEGWRTGRMGKVDLNLLRLAVYEIRFDEDIPTGVAINEAVEIAKKYGGDHSASFVNGILGKIARMET